MNPIDAKAHSYNLSLLQKLPLTPFEKRPIQQQRLIKQISQEASAHFQNPSKDRTEKAALLQILKLTLKHKSNNNLFDITGLLTESEKFVRRVIASQKLIKAVSSGDSKPVYSTDWHTRHIPNWESWLKDIKGKPIQALEVGSYEGLSARWLMENILTHRESSLYCVDTWRGSDEHQYPFKLNPNEYLWDFFVHNLNPWLTIQNKRVIPVKGKSQQRLLDLPENSFDLIYLDGSHKAEDVYADASIAHQLLRKNGIMIFDDYAWDYYPSPEENPRAGIEDFLQDLGFDYKIIGKGRQLALQKE